MKLSVIMLVSLALAGCAHDSSKTTASMDDSTSTSTASASEGSSTAANWDGVVQSIDPAGAMSAGGAVGATAAGSGSGYRVTVKKADGSVESVNVDSMPSYRVGDNVRYSNGSLSSSPKY
jgi:proline racemase